MYLPGRQDLGSVAQQTPRVTSQGQRLNGFMTSQNVGDVWLGIGGEFLVLGRQQGHSGDTHPLSSASSRPLIPPALHSAPRQHLFPQCTFMEYRLHAQHLPLPSGQSTSSPPFKGPAITCPTLSQALSSELDPHLPWSRLCLLGISLPRPPALRPTSLELSRCPANGL